MGSRILTAERNDLMKMLFVTATMTFLLSLFTHERSAEAFFDDFSNLSATDGDPVTWIAGLCEDCSRDAS